MGTIAEGETRADQGADFATKALVFGLAGPVLLVAGFGWVPFAFELAPVLAIVSLVYATRTLRRPHERRHTVMALSGAALAVLTVLAFAFVLLAFAFGSGD